MTYKLEEGSHSFLKLIFWNIFKMIYDLAELIRSSRSSFLQLERILRWSSGWEDMSAFCAEVANMFKILIYIIYFYNT